LSEGQAAMKQVEARIEAEKKEQLLEDKKADKAAKEAFEQMEAMSTEKAAKIKAESSLEDTGETSFLDAVNTSNLSTKVSPKEIAKATSQIE
jgi:hypothetical protein